MQRHCCPSLHQGGYRSRRERQTMTIYSVQERGLQEEETEVSKDLLTTLWKPEQTALSTNLQASVEAVDSQFQHTSTNNPGRREISPSLKAVHAPPAAQLHPC